MNSRNCAGARFIRNNVPRVTINQGVLYGEFLSHDVKAFKGVRYARPPIGQLRWRPPVAVDASTDVQRAVEFGSACLQIPAPAGSVYADKPNKMSEDCLFLNVWTASHSRDTPVMVWLHGGALRIGDPASSMYDGSALAEKGVVVVTVNYRLGILGYFSHPELTAESPNDSSGNYGFLDQMEALRWVRENISAFGGDPNNVTVFGESAGALSVMALMASPLARGLFNKAILQSGYMSSNLQLKRTCFGLPSAESIGYTLGNELNANNLSRLRSIPADFLVARATACGFEPRPVVDGWVLPKQIIECFDQGEQAPVPIIVGFNSGEMRSLRTFVPPLPKTKEQYQRLVERIYGDLTSTYLAHYPPTDIEESALAAARDAACGWSAERLAKLQTKIAGSAYLYLFAHEYPREKGRHLEAFHGSELPYEFGRIGAAQGWPPYWPRPPDDKREHALSESIISYFTSFARTGVPVAPGKAVWKSYENDRAFMEFREFPRCGHHLLPGMFELHEEVIARRRADGTQYWGRNIGLASPPVPSASVKLSSA